MNISSLLAHESVKNQATALWLIGEIFRVLGKRMSKFLRLYLEQLKQTAETDDNRVVRIHCLGAIKATAWKQTKSFE